MNVNKPIICFRQIPQHLWNQRRSNKEDYLLAVIELVQLCSTVVEWFSIG